MEIGGGVAKLTQEEQIATGLEETEFLFRVDDAVRAQLAAGGNILRKSERERLQMLGRMSGEIITYNNTQ